MLIIKQSRLRYSEGSSDKVYEVDFCKMTEDEFVVNFRYGRFGSRLREGTKTTFPVDLAGAERIYDRLLAEKLRNGYQEQSVEGAVVESEQTDEIVNDSVADGNKSFAPPAKVKAILQRLKTWKTDVSEKHWPVSRVIWRAGQLQIRESLPLLAQRVDTSLSNMELYAISWAISRIALVASIEEKERGLAILKEIDQFAYSPEVKRIVREARLLCKSASEAKSFIAEEKAKLSREVQDRLEEEYLSDYLKSKAFYQRDDAVTDLEILYTMSLLDGAVLETIVDFAREVEISEGSFRLIRLLYKLSEARQDGALYGQLVTRLEYEATKSRVVWEQTGKRRRWEPVKRGVFSRSTKRYFKNRSVSSLMKMAEDGDVAGYITMATSVLVAANSNIPEYRNQVRGEYIWDAVSRRSSFINVYSPRYANLYCLTWLTRGASLRLSLSNGLHWSYLPNQSPEGDVKGLREEPNQEFWDQAPDAVIHLLKHAGLEEVQAFAHAVWRANESFVDEVNVEDIVAFIRSFYSETKQLGCELVEKFWDAENPNYALLEALLISGLDEVMQIGFRYLGEVIDDSLNQPLFIARLFLINRIEVHERLRGLYLNKVLPGIYTEIARLLPTKSSEECSPQLAVETLEMLKSEDSDSLVELEELERLKASEDEQAMWYALYCYQTYAKQDRLVPEGVIVDAVESEHSSLRSMGVILLESISDEKLVAQTNLIASCCTSKSPELRQGILPVLTRLVKISPEFGAEMVESLYSIVLRKEQTEGVHDDVLAILLGPLESSLAVIPADTYRRVLKSKYAAAHGLGFYLLEKEVDLDSEALLQLLEWCNHPHSILRNKIISHLDESPERLMMQLGDSRQLVESEWDEVREFGMEFLRNRVPEERWTVEILVDLCDSVKPMVQDFGREMITKRFSEEDGQAYLTKLSQHPTREMQHFATHFLKQAASGQPEMILGLEFYYRAVMGAVSSGRVAKDRVLSFLIEESNKDETVAKMSLDLWYDHAATCAIADKASMLQAIFTVQKSWPDLGKKLEYVPVVEREVQP